MNISSIVIGTVLIAACFGLMVWGWKYLGEKAGRNPEGTDKNGTSKALENPCRSCGACGNTREKE